MIEVVAVTILAGGETNSRPSSAICANPKGSSSPEGVSMLSGFSPRFELFTGVSLDKDWRRENGSVVPIDNGVAMSGLETGIEGGEEMTMKISIKKHDLLKTSEEEVSECTAAKN